MRSDLGEALVGGWGTHLDREAVQRVCPTPPSVRPSSSSLLLSSLVIQKSIHPESNKEEEDLGEALVGGREAHLGQVLVHDPQTAFAQPIRKNTPNAKQETVTRDANLSTTPRLHSQGGKCQHLSTCSLFAR